MMILQVREHLVKCKIIRPARPEPDRVTQSRNLYRHHSTRVACYTASASQNILDSSTLGAQRSNKENEFLQAGHCVEYTKI